MADGPTYKNGVQWRVSGIPKQPFRDLFPRLMGASWTVTIFWAFAAYVGTCVLFAGLFALEPHGVRGAKSTADLMWFSVQTLSTIGYGGMTPATAWANFLVIVESFIGLAGVAVVTAILYAKFSLPEARVQFSECLAVHDWQGVPTLHIRMVNERVTPILDADIHVGVLVDESEEGRRFRRLHDVPLVRSRVPFFALSFTMMHVLDDSSPLRVAKNDPERLHFIIVTVRGVDGRTLQPVFTRTLFNKDDLRFGMGFADMVDADRDGVAILDMTRINAMVPRPFTKSTERGS
ncbi:MAG: ion channel [Myxococcota bacterium]